MIKHIVKDFFTRVRKIFLFIILWYSIKRTQVTILKMLYCVKLYEKNFLVHFVKL